MKQKKIPKSDEMVSGYTLSCGAVPYHFDHIKKKDADALAKLREFPHIVETVNWTFANGSKGSSVHHNRYFTPDLKSAISLATQLEIESQDVAEEVVLIRPVESETEMDEADRAMSHFVTPESEAVPSL